MIRRFMAWHRSRTARERLLLQIAGVLIFLIAAPLWAYSAAASHRAHAAADLAAAQKLRADVAALAQATPRQSAQAGADGSLRARALAAAEAEGLSVSRIEAGGADRIRLSFDPANSIKIYRWIDAMSRSGASVVSTTMARTGEGDTVSADFEVAASP